MTKAAADVELPTGGQRSRLDSWKEIASYLKRSVRTVRRWERKEGLPVHRHLHGKQGTLYAFQGEIDAWLKGRTQEPGASRLAGLSGVRTRPAVLAILPLRNLDDGDPAQDSFASGLTQEMIQEVGQASPKRLRVIAATSVMQYKGTRKTVAQIGQELKADYILEGDIRRYGNRVRLTARLVGARDQARIWGENFELQLPPIFSLQQLLARQLAQALAAVVREPGRKRRPPVRPSVAAHTAYLEGRSHFTLTDGESKKCIERLFLAIERDPLFAPSYAELALVYFRRLFLSFPPIVSFQRVHDLAHKAVKLDPTLARAHAMLGANYLFGVRKWRQADAAIRRATQLNPSDVWAWILRTAYCIVTGEDACAMQELQHATQLAPQWEEHGIWFAVLAYFARQYDFAIERLTEILQSDPTLPIAHTFLGLCYAQGGDYPTALSHSEKALERTDATTWDMSAACSVYAMAGDSESAERLYQELLETKERDYVRYIGFAYAAASMRKNEQALDWLELAYEQHEPLLVFLTASPRFDHLRDLSRFRRLLRDLGLPARTKLAAPAPQKSRVASAR